MPLPFNPVFDVEPDAAVQSETIEFTGTGASTVTIPAAGDTENNLSSFELLVNGVSHGPGSSATVNPGDMLQAKGVASSAFSTATYGHIIVDYVGYVPFGVMTKQDPANTSLDPTYVLSPQTDYYGGYTLSSPNNRLLSVNTSDKSASHTNLSVSTSTDPATIGDGKDYLFASDYIANKVHRIDPDTGAVVQSINVNKPYGLAYTPTESPVENEPAHVIVSSPDEGKVFVFDDTYTLAEEVATGAGPHGVCGMRSEAQGDYSFWVACMDADRVEHWHYTNGVALVRDYYYTLSSGSKPYEVAVDKDGNAWVTCLGSDKVAKCPVGGSGTVEYVTMPEPPGRVGQAEAVWGITLSDTHAYVACSGSDIIGIIDMSDMSVSYQEVFTNPTHVEIVGSDLYVGSFNFGTLKAYPMSDSLTLGTPVDVAISERMFEGLVGSFDAAMTYALNMHNDLPERTALTDLQPESMTFISQSNVGSGQQAESNTVTVTDVSGDVPLFVPGDVSGILSTGIDVNGVASSVPATVTNQDEVAVTVTTPTDTTAIPRLHIPVFYPGGVSVWVVSMTPGEKERVAGWIQGG